VGLSRQAESRLISSGQIQEEERFMKSQVYFIPVKESDNIPTVQDKLRRLLAESAVLDFIPAGSRAVIKLHFGEEGNTGFVKPDYVRVIAERVRARQASTVVSDTNTLYRGMRMNSKDHTALAGRHGFTKEKTLSDVLIPEDGPDTVASVAINQKFIKTAKVAKLFLDADALIDVTHFKGHLMTGFGGALKNIGMGCASREGKLAQHSDLSPIVYEQNCVGCGACVDVCPVDAVTLVNEKSHIDQEKCIGCASCIAACSYHAIDVKWESGASRIQEKMVEYAKAVLDHQKGKAAFINFALKITKECDCLAKDDPRISPDIGILASKDPVALDKACYDLVLKACGKDVIKENHPQRDGMKQLHYAAELGLGNLDYELVTVTG